MKARAALEAKLILDRIVAALGSRWWVPLVLAAAAVAFYGGAAMVAGGAR